MKLLAGIYRPDSGRVEVRGHCAPVLDLGVGFDGELAARDNAIINGVMLGLSPKEARARTDQIIDFAELHDHSDAQLKHLSSGMKVRLAFATMLASDPDVLLIDEVLTVGDRQFREKSGDAMVALRERGKTIVLVTHSMSAIEQLCSKAMLLEGGKVARIGDPGEVAAAYLEVNLEGEEALHDPDLGTPRVEIAHAGLRAADGGPRASVDREEALEISAELRVAEGAARPEPELRGPHPLRADAARDPLDSHPRGRRPGAQAGRRPGAHARGREPPPAGQVRGSSSRSRAPFGRSTTCAASRTFEFPFVVSGDPVAGSRIALKHDLRVAASAPATLAQQLDRALESARPRAGV